jgi:hypothetical protein
MGKKEERWQAIQKMKCLPLGECKLHLVIMLPPNKLRQPDQLFKN